MLTDYRKVIKAPIVSEKSSTLRETENKYVFSVDLNANKTHIKQAVEKIFNVEVESVNIINRKPKVKRVGRIYGKRNKVRKAIVKVKDGQSIEF